MVQGKKIVTWIWRFLVKLVMTCILIFMGAFAVIFSSGRIATLKALSKDIGNLWRH